MTPQTAPSKSFGHDLRRDALTRHELHETRRKAALKGAEQKEAEEHAIHMQALKRLSDVQPTNQAKRLGSRYRSDLRDVVMALEHRCDEAGARITALEQQILRLMDRT